MKRSLLRNRIEDGPSYTDRRSHCPRLVYVPYHPHPLLTPTFRLQVTHPKVNSKIMSYNRTGFSLAHRVSNLRYYQVGTESEHLPVPLRTNKPPGPLLTSYHQTDKECSW